jgi:ribose 5-phosphate isomerase B
MKIYLGADHNGFTLKGQVLEYLQKRGCDVIDKGDTKFDANDDFPVFAAQVATAIVSSEDEQSRGVLICGSGQGMMIAANRFKGIRAGLGWSIKATHDLRNDEDCNVLCLPSAILKDGEWQAIIDEWLKTPFAAAGRYVRRNKELDSLC